MRRRFSQHVEVEARFLIQDPTVHRAVARLRVIDGFQVVRRRREHQRNTYLDTPTLALRRARTVLKLRQIGRRRELILKQALNYRRGVARHLEVAASLQAGQQQQLLNGRLDLEPARRAQALAGTHTLREVFSLHTDRRSHILAKGAQEVELDVDSVILRRGGRVVGRRLEVELENLTASSHVFRGVWRALRHRFGNALRPSRVSKFEYGLGLLRLKR